MKPALLLVFVVVACNACNGEKKTAEEIYNSGIVEDTADFVLIKSDEYTLRYWYQYRYDTLLVARKNYRNINDFSGWSFYYNGIPEGKWLLLNENGNIDGEVHFKNGLYDGDFIVYENGIIKNKTLYSKNKPVYEIKYDAQGKMIDSTSQIK